VTHIVREHSYAFEIIEQNLALGGIRLLGGDYTLCKLSEDRTRVALATRYASSNYPRWLFGRVEAAVCHSFQPLHLNRDAEQSLVALKFRKRSNDLIALPHYWLIHVAVAPCGFMRRFGASF
jgi:hypothetical protein